MHAPTPGIGEEERRSSPIEAEQQVARALVLAFAPVHKSAFGIALGAAAALAIALATIVSMAVEPTHTGIELLSVYFHGYDVSWSGLFVGAAWGAGVGFVAGWFLAFARNFLVACWLLYFRVRANLAQTRDFLDHI